MKILQFVEANDATDAELSCELRSFSICSTFSRLINFHKKRRVQAQQQQQLYTIYIHICVCVGVCEWVCGVWVAWDVQVLIIYCMFALHSSACEMRGKMPQEMAMGRGKGTMEAGGGL